MDATTIPHERRGEHELLRRLAADHRDRCLSAGLRGLAHDAAYGTLVLPFPHFTDGALRGSDEPASELGTLRARLERAAAVLTLGDGTSADGPKRSTSRGSAMRSRWTQVRSITAIPLPRASTR